MENQNDRLSALPDILLEDILSLLPTKSAAAASVLSRRWRQLWTRVTRLHFDTADFSTVVDPRMFLTIVDSALRRLDSFSNIRYFYLRFRLFTYASLDYVENSNLCLHFLNRWLVSVCGLHTEHIDISCYNILRVRVQNSSVAKTTVDFAENIGDLESPSRLLCLPQCVFQSETLTELLLDNPFRYQLPEFVNFPNLQKLSLYLRDGYRDLMPTLFKSLPLLEELTLLSNGTAVDNLIDISAPRLKMFAIKFSGDGVAQILIDAPKLESISIDSYYPLLIYFVVTPSALSTARLLFKRLGGYLSFRNDVPNLTLELLKVISCVRSLYTYDTTFQNFDFFDVDALPSFPNLIHLNLILESNFLNPDVPVWLLRKVKTIEVMANHSIEMTPLEKIISKADALERLCVSMSYGLEGGIDTLLRELGIDAQALQRELGIDMLQRENEIIEALFMLPRVSARYEVEFKGFLISASTNDS